MSRRHRFASLGGCFSVLVAVAIGTATAATPPQAPLPQAPPISGPTVTGGTASLAALRGKPVFLNVWSSW